MFKKILFSILFVLFLLAFATAQVPQLINYQGMLTDADGNPVNGTLSIQFKIYENGVVTVGETPLWNETQSVTLTDGIYSVLLGSITPIPYSVFDGSIRYLGTTIGADAESIPRRVLVSVGYAFRANNANNLEGIYIQNGNVGIGKTDPTEALDVVGNVHASGGFIAGNTTIYNDGEISTTEDIDITTATTSQLYIDIANNSVGIGTTSPNGKLHVQHGTMATVNIGGNSAGDKAQLGLFEDSDAGEETGIRLEYDGVNDEINFVEYSVGNKGENLVTFQRDGKVGIGTASPTADLHVDGDHGVLFTGKAGSGTIPAEGAGTRMMWYPRKGAFRAGNISPGDPTLWDDTNIGFWSVATGWGTKASGAHSFAAGVQAQANHSGTFVWNDNAVTGGDIFASTAEHQFLIRARGGVGIGTNTPLAELDVVGTTRTTVLEITGGSDLAEPFDIAGSEAIEAGMVVAIDPENPGQLRIADKAYDRTVAGCVSGANGINPGLTMRQQGTVVDGSLLVALSGRVYCWTDASYGAIQPGDLLTTSDTPGHAMKVTDYTRAQGAILGKAMTSLEQGRALVLLLVTLQ